MFTVITWHAWRLIASGRPAGDLHFECGRTQCQVPSLQSAAFFACGVASCTA